MRGGQVYIQGYAGYRAGIHMKEYMDKVPLIVIGGKGGDFLGEYMAGGRIVVLGLGLGENEMSAGRFFGTGMHGGMMYIRGKVNEALMGREIAAKPLDQNDEAFLRQVTAQYAAYFGADVSAIQPGDFRKYHPKASARTATCTWATRTESSGALSQDTAFYVCRACPATGTRR
jgi:glutamate synthase domain-containing protein 3